MHRFVFADQLFFALVDRALYWPAHRALLVADLHLEKASWLAAGGQMLPPYDSHATLTRLHALVHGCEARAVWTLGDSFHDPAGPERLDRESRALLDEIGRIAPITWIEGNHDCGGTLPGAMVDAMVVDGIVLRHESERHEPRPEISGHFHPKVTIDTGARRLSRPCVAMNPRRMILPSFGSLTGGLSVESPAIRDRIGAPVSALVATPRQLLRVELSTAA